MQDGQRFLVFTLELRFVFHFDVIAPFVGSQGRFDDVGFCKIEGVVGVFSKLGVQVGRVDDTGCSRFDVFQHAQHLLEHVNDITEFQWRDGDEEMVPRVFVLRAGWNVFDVSRGVVDFPAPCRKRNKVLPRDGKLAVVDLEQPGGRLFEVRHLGDSYFEPFCTRPVAAE